METALPSNNAAMESALLCNAEVAESSDIVEAEWFGNPFEFATPQFWTCPMQQPLYDHWQSSDAGEVPIDVMDGEAYDVSGLQFNISGQAVDVSGQVFNVSAEAFFNEQGFDLSWEPCSGQSFNDCVHPYDIEMPWLSYEIHASHAAQQYPLLDEQLATSDLLPPPTTWDAQPSPTAILSTSPPQARQEIAWIA